MAAERGYDEVVDILLTHGADIEAKDKVHVGFVYWSVCTFMVTNN